MSGLIQIVGWEAWFVDIPEQTKVTRYSSKDTEFKDLPSDGLLGIVMFMDEAAPSGYLKRVLWNGYDYYFLAKGVNADFIGCDVDTRERFAPTDIKERYPSAIIIRGAFTDMGTLIQVKSEMQETQWLQ